MRLISIFVMLSCAACTCAPPSRVDVPCKLTPAPGLDPSAYSFFGPDSPSPGSIGKDGTFSASVGTNHAGFLMAVPQERAGLSLASETGLYLTPVSGGARLAGPPWEVTTTKPAVLNATTTVISFLLQHPMFAHPAPDVQRRQVEWFAQRLKSGWPAITEAATGYDRGLSTGSDPFADVSFVAALQLAATEAQTDLPQYEPLAESGLKQQGLSGASVVTLASGHKVVTSVETAGGNAVKPGTEVGTALDYLYVVRPLPSAEFPLGKDDPGFLAADALKMRAWGRPTTAGYIAASSYASYADVVGNVMKWTTKFWSTPVAPAEEVPLGAPGFYEVRFFSGALGVGTPANEYAFASTNFSADARAAFIHNVTAGTFEAVGMIPGAGEVFGSEVGAQVAQEVVQQLVVDLEALLSSKGPALIEADDIYAIGFNAVKAAVDKAAEKVTEDAQKSSWKQLFAWVKWGGKKAVKAVMDLPGKIARGGALTHRAVRLTAPYSVTELHLALVGEAALPETIPARCTWSPSTPTGSSPTAATSTGSCREHARSSWRRIQNWVWARFAYTVAPNEPARLVLDFANLTVSPMRYEFPPNPMASERTVFTVESVAFSQQYEQFYVTPGGTITGSSSGHTLRADFTIPPSKSPTDYSFATASGGFQVRGTLETFDKVTGALITRVKDYDFTSAPPYLGYYSVEAK